MRLALLLFTGSLAEPGRAAHDPLQAALRYARHAEALGWDEVWTTEHHFNPHVVNPCALTLGAYLLGQTHSLTVGTGVVVLPHTHPVRLAAQAALLQHVSGGRLRLGVGRGGQTLELELFGRGVEAWRGGFAHLLGELKRLLETGEVRSGTPLVPQPPPIPLVVAATSEATVRSAAQHGVPFILGFPFPDEVKTQLLDVYRQTAAADLYAGGEHWVSAVVHFARSKEQALRELRSSFVPWNLRAAAATAWLEPPAHTPGSAQWEEIIGMQALGTPEDVAERLVALTQLSGTENLLLAADGTLEPAQTLENLERLAVEVRPMLVGSSQQAVRGAP